MEIQSNLAITVGSLFGVLSVVFGAFGAHALKKKMSAELLVSFETGVRYQMYHALLLCVMAVLPSSTMLDYAIKMIIIGVVLFSFSIYGLCLSATFGTKIKAFGPITPLGGLFLVAGWAMILINFIG